ncbi:MAG: hypothetical protein ABSG33_07460 [Candidatus Bathyarchaeia archaeon]|jgi:hypothetical protein
MVSKIKVVSATVIAILFASALAGTIVYYNGVVKQENSKIASLNNQIANQNTEIANLNNQISLLTNPKITAQLGVAQIGVGNSIDAYGADYWRLFIQGSAVNVGNMTAYNAGLKVIAYATSGHIAINMTVPLVNGYNYGTDAAIVSDIGYDIGPTQLGNLTAGQCATVNLDIYHEGVLANWTVTPVWTNSP